VEGTVFSFDFKLVVTEHAKETGNSMALIECTGQGSCIVIGRQAAVAAIMQQNCFLLTLPTVRSPINQVSSI
jgi:hypothetical protein